MESSAQSTKQKRVKIVKTNIKKGACHKETCYQILKNNMFRICDLINLSVYDRYNGVNE